MGATARLQELGIKLPAPVDNMDSLWTPSEAAGVAEAFKEAVVGSAATVRRGIEAFVARTRVDEVMVSAMIHDPAARLRSFEIVAEATGLAAAGATSSDPRP